MTIQTTSVEFIGSQGELLRAKLDMPAGTVKAIALFAHCFTCSKDLLASRHIAATLAARGIGVLRFDFTGLGASGGDFSNTNFSSNVEDLVLAAGFLRENYQAPSILVGHSLGGAAVLMAAADIKEIKAVATIGAPFEAEHVVHNFGVKLDEIAEKGLAQVTLGGRSFTIRKQFIDDLNQQNMSNQIGSLKTALMVLHSPIDQTVGIENAAAIFTAAKHPKSFVSLDSADHLLSGKRDAAYAAEMIATWATRFLDDMDIEVPEHEGVLVVETGIGKFQNRVHVGNHTLLADEPLSVGGLDTGPTPYDFLAAAIAACTSMTLRIYADFKKLPLEKVEVEVVHEKVHAQDCDACMLEDLEKTNSKGKIDRFERRLKLYGPLSQSDKASLLRIADKCPVHQTVENGAAIVTRLTD